MSDVESALLDASNGAQEVFNVVRPIREKVIGPYSSEELAEFRAEAPRIAAEVTFNQACAIVAHYFSEIDALAAIILARGDRNGRHSPASSDWPQWLREQTQLPAGNDCSDRGTLYTMPPWLAAHAAHRPPRQKYCALRRMVLQGELLERELIGHYQSSTASLTPRM